MAPELGSERRETVRFLSTINENIELKKAVFSTKGLKLGVSLVY